MKRGSPKKSPAAPTERRKTPRGRSKGSLPSKQAAQPAPSKGRRASTASSVAVSNDQCQHCAKKLKDDDRALFVEEEVGRVFCSEACITGYFAPQIDRLEKEYTRRLVAGDLTGEERENLAHLRYITLQEPDETWREKTLTGDHRYTLISEFEPGNRSVWSICICLFLRNEPSFLFIAFTTQNEAMMQAYRRGEQIPSVRSENKITTEESSPELGDRLADNWTEEETFLAESVQQRSPQDIPASEFASFQGCLEETLETPDEVWSLETGEPEGAHLYHFIRRYTKEPEGHWYVILARETEDEEQIEIIDAFPTRDPSLVERYRRGVQEVGDVPDSRPASRLVH